MKTKLFKRPALMVCALAVLCLAITAVLSASPTYAAPVNVGTWGDFVTELANPATTEIILAAPLTATSSATISRDIIINGDGNTLTLAGNNLVLGTVAMAATLRLKDIQIDKVAGTTNAIVGTGTAANWGLNWRVELENVTTGTAAAQRGFVNAVQASVVVCGGKDPLDDNFYGNDLTVNQNAYYLFNVKHFEMAFGSKLKAYSNSTYAVICINTGTVTLREEADLNIYHNGTSAALNASTGAYGIFGGVTDMSLEAKSRLAIEAGYVAYRTNIQNTLTMVGGATFSARGWSGSTNGAVALCQDYGDNDGQPATILLDGAGTELFIETNSTNTANNGAAMRVQGANSSFTVTNGAKITGHHTVNSVIQLYGDGMVFNVSHGAEIDLLQDAGTYNLGATLRFRMTGGQTFNIDGGKVNITKNGGDAPAVRLYGGNNKINLTDGGEFYIYNAGGTSSPQRGDGSNDNHGIFYTNGSANQNDGFYISGERSIVKIVADLGPAVAADNSNAAQFDVIVGPGAIFILEGTTNSYNSGTLAGYHTSAPFNFVLDNPLYFDIRNNCSYAGSASQRTGAPAVYSAITNGNTTASKPSFSLINSDLAVWERAPRNTPLVDFDDAATATWTMFNCELRGAMLQQITFTDIPSYFYNNVTTLTGTATTGTYLGTEFYSRISANNARPIIDGLRVPTDADKYLHGHASVPEGIGGMRDAWPNEVYVTIQVKDAGGVPVSIKDMYGNYTTTAEFAISPDDLEVYGDPPRDGIFKIPYEPLNTVDVYGNGFLPVGYTFEVLSAYRSSMGSKAMQIAAGETTPRVHESIYATDIEGPLLENQGAVFVTCIDKTPPKPAGINGEIDDLLRLTVAEGSQAITGTSAEKTGVTVIFTVNGVIVTTDGTLAGAGGTPVTATVGSGGTWQLDVPSYMTLELDDVIQVFLTDSEGNKNPVDDTEFHDALFITDDHFPAGTIAYVVESAFILHIRQVVYNPGNIPMRAWPNEGYSTIMNQRSNLAIAPKKYNVVTSAGFSAAAEYTTVELKGVFKNNTVRIQNIIPQYFTPAGYQLSSTAPTSLAAPTSGDSITVNTDREYWVTVYISPVNHGTIHYSGGIKDHYFGPVTG